MGDAELDRIGVKHTYHTAIPPVFLADSLKLFNDPVLRLNERFALWKSGQRWGVLDDRPELPLLEDGQRFPLPGAVLNLV